MAFILKEIFTKDIKEEMEKIGFDSAYLDIAKNKHEFKNIKIYDLTPVQATILKQTALSVGCDLATNRDVLTHSIERSDAILSGTISEIKKVIKSLKAQQFSMPSLADEIEKIIENNKRVVPKIMAILNLSKDSFSNEEYDPYVKADEFLSEGVDIIDIGAESTAPNREDVPDDVQIKMLSPILKYLKGKTKISVDTRSAKVAEFAIKNGADIINDVSFLSDKNMAKTVIDYNKTLVLMHSKGNPKTMDKMCEYSDIEEEIYKSLYKKICELEELGYSSQNLIIDMGFGFAKNVEQNFELMKKIKNFKSLGYPILCGVSRKRFIQSVAKEKSLEELDILTSISSFYFALQDIDILRVHNPYLTRLALDFAKLL